MAKKEPVEEVKDEKKELLDKMTAILREFNGESNVPLNHDYWDLRNEYQRLTSQ